MKTIKELEVERNQTIMNIDNCESAECNHKGWDEDLERINKEIQILKEVLEVIDEFAKEYKGTDWARGLEELKARINGK